MKTSGPIIEACVNGLDSALAAQQGGAARIELCDNLYEGGTTPSLAAIRKCRLLLDIRLFVIIRPRGGDFLYSEQEFEMMQEDILLCKDAGVDGIVSGILLKDGSVDVKRTRVLRELSSPMDFTFHRAFDMVADHNAALEAVIDTGATRILTSGGARSAYEGATRITKLREQTSGRIIIMPGGKINEENIRVIRDITGVGEFHVSLRSPVESEMIFRNEKVKMGIDTIDEYTRMITDADRISNLINILENND